MKVRLMYLAPRPVVHIQMANAAPLHTAQTGPLMICGVDVVVKGEGRVEDFCALLISGQIVARGQDGRCIMPGAILSAEEI